MLAVLLWLALGWLGVKGGIEQWPESQSLGQRVQSVAQLAYGLLSILAVATVARSDTLTTVVRVSWLAAITIAGGMAPVVWGDAAWGAGLVAGLASFVVGLLVLWMVRVVTRGLTRA